MRQLRFVRIDSRRRSRVFFVIAPLVLWLGSIGPATGEGGAQRSRFGPERVLITDPARWVTFGGARGVVGSETSLTLVDSRSGLVTGARLQLETPLSEGQLVAQDLYLVERGEAGERLVVLDIDAPEAGTSVVELVPPAAGALHLARMDDYLLVAEDGYGVRILELPHLHHRGPANRGPTQVGRFPLAEPIVALTASLRTVYVMGSSGLTVIDAVIPAAPSLAFRRPLEGAVTALAANGSTLYLLGPEGLRIVDSDALAGGTAEQLHPEVRGNSIYLAGRTVYVAGGGGLSSIEDRSSQEATIFIQVGDNFFQPEGIVNVNSGDTVTWQKPATIFSHNIFSCNGVLPECLGQSSTEEFVSGPTTTAAFSFSFTFTVVGSNQYRCFNHPVSMFGNIIVNAVATPPPGVADGRNSTEPMTVERLSVDAADLRINYDAAACGADADDHNILFGTRAELPGSPGGIYGLTGNRCDIGTVSPFDWIASPAVLPGAEYLWWIVVSDDGGGKEGSWSGSSGGERDGPGVNGASDRCGNTDKDLTNTCPP